MHCNPLYKGELQEPKAKLPALYKGQLQEPKAKLPALYKGQLQEPQAKLPAVQAPESPIARAAESWHRRLAGSPARCACVVTVKWLTSR